MSIYSIPKLLQKWTLGELTTDQALGYVLQNMAALLQWLTEDEICPKPIPLADASPR